MPPQCNASTLPVREERDIRPGLDFERKSRYSNISKAYDLRDVDVHAVI